MLVMMDEVFRALSNPTRRGLLDGLREESGQSLQTLCESNDLTRQALSRHLDVLEAANLISIHWHGREKLHYLNPVPLHEIVHRWIQPFESPRLDVITTLKHTLEDPMDKPQFVYTIYIQATQERVYQALTERELLDAYMDGTGPLSDWEPGSPVRWKSMPGDDFEDLDQEVIEAIPGKRLSYTWHTLQPMHRELFSSDEEFETATREQSTVTFDIEPAEDQRLGTKLTITHHDFDSHESQMLKSVSGGWIMILSNLKTYLETGRTPA